MSSLSSMLEPLEPRQLMSATPLYKVTNLVSDGSVPALHVDKNLKNPWGLAIGHTGLRVANAGSGVSTHYNSRGELNASTVPIPGGGGGAAAGIPTGIVFNDTNDFVIKSGSKSAPAEYVYVNIDGGIVGYNAKVSSKGVLAEDSSDEGNVYTGAAIASSGGKNYLYAVDFAGRRIEVYDGKFHDADNLKGHFVDPKLPKDYKPFNIAEYDGHLFVTEVDVPAGAKKEKDGKGLGIVDEFNTDGTFVKRFATGGNLNAPWGMVWGPYDFGGLVKKGDMLVGNFGSGHIEVYTDTGTYKGTLMKAGADDDDDVKKAATTKTVTSPVEAYGMWGLAFGNGKNGTANNTLYFNAGINDEKDGLFGAITIG